MVLMNETRRPRDGGRSQHLAKPVTPLPRKARIALIALVSVALLITGVLFVRGMVTPEQALGEALVLLWLCGFVWRPVPALITVLAVGIVAIPADGGVYALLLAMAFGLVVYTTGLFWTCLYGACVIAISLSGELITDEISFGGSLIVTATGAASGLIGWGLKQGRERERALSTDLARISHDRDQAVRLERERIADELHNIVAHDITLVLMHVRAHHLMKDSVEGQEQALNTIERAAEQALTNIHRMLQMVDEKPGEDLDRTPVDDLLRTMGHELGVLPREVVNG